MADTAGQWHALIVDCYCTVFASCNGQGPKSLHKPLSDPLDQLVSRRGAQQRFHVRAAYVPNVLCFCKCTIEKCKVTALYSEIFALSFPPRHNTLYY